MSLQPGTRVGTYEITAQIGVGGMGEVYRATDTKLKRAVAIKVLPPAVAADPERLARFQREAEVLASLNHPNIAAIHGLDESDGIKALVMELVEGPTLADRIAQGPIPVDEALPIAKQIAEALEAAHEQGIIHRDLKPANIKLRPDGAVKVLDFGLAKAMEPASEMSAANASQLPTITTPAMTQAGIILGTAAYMSPEQAKGRPVDRRTDVWAFGAVLYEMLTGRRAFAGEDVSDTMASVLKADTDWSAVPSGVPPRVVTVMRRCLQRDPRQRIHDVADLRLALEGAFETAEPLASVATAYAARAGWRRALPFAATAAAATVLTGLGAWFLRPPAAQEVVARFAYVIPDDQPFRSNGRPIMAVSPDGRAFVYNTAGGLYLRTMGELESRLIPGTEEVLGTPFFSPDGEWVAYQSGGELRRIGTSGGSAVVIADVPENLFGSTWGDDGRILYGQSDGIFRVSASGGAPELVIPAEEGELFYGPQLLPGGDRVLFTVTTAQGADRWDRGQIVVQSLASGDRTVLIEGGSDAYYVRTGYLVYARGRDLLGVAFDVRALTTSGGSVPLVQGVRRAANPQSNTASANYGVSEQGTLVYLTGDEGLVAPLWVDASGREEPTRTPGGRYQTVSLSPDGRWAALGAIGENGNADVWISELARGTLTRLTTDPGQETNPLWSPDGQRVAYVTDRNGSLEVVWRNADGSGSVEMLLTPGGEADALRPQGWSPDGTVLFVCLGQGGNLDMGMVTVGEPDSWRPLRQTPASECTLALSPDGRWLAYGSNESGGYQVYVERFPEGTGRQAVSITNGIRPRWSDDGRTLVYDRSWPAGGPLAVARVTVAGGTSESDPLRFGDQTDLFVWTYYDAPGGRFWDMTREGDRFLVLDSSDAAEGGQTNQVIVVQHWTEELKRLVPTD